MKSKESWSVMIVSCKFKINDLINRDLQISGNSIKESNEMLLLNLVNIVFISKWLNRFTHKLIDDVGG